MPLYGNSERFLTTIAAVIHHKSGSFSMFGLFIVVTSFIGGFLSFFGPFKIKNESIK